MYNILVADFLATPPPTAPSALEILQDPKIAQKSQFHIPVIQQYLCLAITNVDFYPDE